MNLGANLKEARTRAGLKQREVAEALGVRQKDISNWENNAQTPSTLTFKRMCEVLNASADEILELNKK